MKRLEVFHSFATHGWLKRVYVRLKKDDLRMAIEFIDKNDALDKGNFDFAINRMFLGNENKPKNWTLIMELLSCANSRAG